MTTAMQGKTVLITGGTGGIGRETAIALAKLGATVVVAGRDAARSSIYLASSPEAATVSGAYYDTNSRPAAWPKPVLDEALRRQLWATYTRLAGLAPSPAPGAPVGGPAAALA